MYNRRLRVFVSSRMLELAPERRAIGAALDFIKVDAWIFEKDAGARPDPIQATYTEELDNADLYLGVFWKGYGRYTADEYDRACSTKKDRLVYIKAADGGPRDPQLDTFLKPIVDVEHGVSWAPFATPEDLAAKVQDDVARWAAAIVHRAIEAGVDRERARQAEIRDAEHAASRQRIVNPAPQAIADLFKDRTQPMADILDALLAGNSRYRAVTVFGQGGIGKTALACCVMSELEKKPNVQGLVYFSTRTTGITFERVYRDCARMLGDATEQNLMALWKNEALGAQARAQALIEAFGLDRSVLLLDNLESVMNDAGTLAESDLQSFLDAFLVQRHGARMLITSREPLQLSADTRKYQKPYPLKDGLPVEFAIELLRELDEDGQLGLLRADEPLLRLAAEKTQGFPAALEAVVSILSETVNPSLERLLADEDLFRDAVNSNLMKRALSHLDADGHRVMQALAVFGRPVRDVAVHYVLEPYVQGVVVHDTLARLARALYINVKQDTGELILHPFYREFSYAQIPTDPASPYNRAALEGRAAAYYAQLRAPREAWKSIRDLDPQLFEFDHWIRAGDWDRAAGVLTSIDVEFLIWQGYARRVRDMRALVDGRIRDRRLQLMHHDSLGQVAMILGHAGDEGLAHFREMETIATGLDDRPAICRARRGLGEMSRMMGRLDDAIRYNREALALARDQTDQQTELQHCLFFLGFSYCYGGYPHDAIACAEEARALAGRPNDVLGIAKTDDVLALAYVMLDDWDQAIDHARLAMAGYRAVRSVDVSYVGNVEGMALVGRGRHDEALQAFQQALADSREVDLPRPQLLVLFNQARTYRGLGRRDAALDSARAALAIANEGRFSEGEATQSLIDALDAAGAGDRGLELRRLLDCARQSLANPDLYPPADLIREVQASAAALKLEALAAEAAELQAAIDARRKRRYVSTPAPTT
jgi:tetratricopeptide (TPR) repeat protein